MKRGRKPRSAFVVSLVMAGGLFLSSSAKGPNREVEIDADCQVDYEVVNLSLHKPGHRVKWTSTQAFDIDFGNSTPCKNGVSKFAVRPHHDSDWCVPDPKAQVKVYKYSITNGSTVCNDPGVSVKDGRDDKDDKNGEGKKPD